MVCKLCKSFGHYAKTCDSGVFTGKVIKSKGVPPKTKVKAKYTHNQYTGPNHAQDKMVQLCIDNTIRSVEEMCLFFGVKKHRDVNQFMLPWVIENCPEHVQFAREHNKAELIDSCNNWRLRAIAKARRKYKQEFNLRIATTENPFDLFATESFTMGNAHPAPTHQALENNPFN